jgi:protein disulfide-isomerase
MRALLTRLCLVLSLAALASSQTPTARPADLEGDVLVRSKSEAGNWSVAYDDTDETPKSTTFNGIEVPPMKDMIGDTFNEDMKNGYW